MAKDAPKKIYLQFTFELTKNRCLLDVFSSCLQIILEQMPGRYHPKLSSSYRRQYIDQICKKAIFKIPLR